MGGRSAGTWKPGTSGNPTGRPKLHPDIIALAKDHSPEAFKRIIRLMKDADDHPTQLRAAQYVIDRAYGKPHQAVDLGSSAGGFNVTVQIVERLPETTDSEAPDDDHDPAP
jgi:hypothetical protein